MGEIQGRFESLGESIDDPRRTEAFVCLEIFPLCAFSRLCVNNRMPLYAFEADAVLRGT